MDSYRCATQLPRRLVVATSLLIGVLTVGLNAQAGGSSAAPAGQNITVGSLIDFCDFRGTSTDEDSTCERSLVAPPGAERTAVYGEPPPTTETGDLAASTAALPPTPAVANQVSFGESPAATSPRAQAGLAGAEARELFEASHPLLVRDLKSVSLPRSAKVIDADGQSVLIDEGPRAGTSLIEASSPLVTGPAGDPVDLRLDLDAPGKGVAPRMPFTDVVLPENAYGAVRLPESQIRFSFDPAHESGGSEGHAAQPVGREGLFYPSVDTDTDLFLAPMPTGFEMFAQLRSVESPEALALNLDIPRGAVLTEADDGSGAVAVVDDAGHSLVRIAPPFAADAAGQPFPVEMVAEDANTLTIKVDHRGAGAPYPILVDPAVEDIYNWSAGSGFTGWAGNTTDSDFAQFQNLPPFPNGLYNYVPSGRSLSPNTLAAWLYYVPNYASGTTAYVSDAYLASAYSTGTTAQDRPRVALGLFSPSSSAWARVKIYSQPYALTGNWLSNMSSLQPGVSPTSAKRVDFQLFSTSSGSTPDTNRTARLDNVTIKLDDTDTPTASLTGIGGWVDGTADRYMMDNAAQDGGLGVKSQSFLQGYDNDNQLVPGSAVTSQCTGTASRPCPQRWSQPFQVDPARLRNGLQAAWSATSDVLGKGYLTGRAYGIDRMGPWAEDIRVETEIGGGLTISAAIRDGNAGTRDTAVGEDWINAESGVKTVELLADGAVLDSSQTVVRLCEGDGIEGNGDPAQEVPWQSCGVDATFTIPPAAMLFAPILTIRMTDQVGNMSTVAPLDEVQSAPVQVRTSCGADVVHEGDVDPLTADVNFDAFGEIGANLFGARYAGTYIDRTCPARFVALIKDGTPAERSSFLTALEADPTIDAETVIVRSAAFTEADIDDASLEVESILDATGVDKYAIATEGGASGLIVITPTTLDDSTVSAIVNAGGHVPVIFDVEADGVEFVHTSRAQYPDYEAGLHIRLQGFSGCTSGFMFERNHHKVGSTAGHCNYVFDEPTVDSSGDRRIGKGLPGGNGYKGRDTIADARIYSMRDRYATRRIYVNPGAHRLVTDKLRNGNLFRGLNLCFQGTTSGSDNCGPIRLFVKVAKIGPPGTKVRESVCITPNARLGDSGGPVYLVRRNGTASAAGMISFRNAKSVDGDRKVYGCFSRIKNILDRLSVDLVEARNPN